MIDIEAIKARANAATEGPWKFTPKILGIKNTTVMAGGEQVGYFSVGQAQPHDAEFVAHARTDIPALIAEVERLRGVVDRVREKIHTARHALHLTGDLDARDLLRHITTAMEDQ